MTWQTRGTLHFYGTIIRYRNRFRIAGSLLRFFVPQQFANLSVGSSRCFVTLYELLMLQEVERMTVYNLSGQMSHEAVVANFNLRFIQTPQCRRRWKSLNRIIHSKPFPKLVVTKSNENVTLFGIRSEI